MHAPDTITLSIEPFEDLSLQQELGIFCRSFSNDLVTELSRFRQFRVIDSTISSTSHKTKTDSPAVTTSTDYVIKGSFRYDRDPVRINVQLVHQPSRHLVWGNRFEGSLDALGELQDSLLVAVVGALQQQINADLLSKMRSRPKVAFSAYEHWLYGMEALKKGSVEADLEARERFSQALAIQPDYALAYTGMSMSYFNEWSCQLWDRWDLAKSGAFEWAQKAIELDDQNYLASMVLGKIFLYDGAWETAEYYFRKSLLLNPNDPDCLVQMAFYMVYLGLGNESKMHYERALQLNPVNSGSYRWYGAFIYLEMGDFARAASLLTEGPSFSKWADADVFVAAIHYYNGAMEKMHEAWQRFLKNYERLIAKGEAFTEKDAIEWILKINPYKEKSQLEAFLHFISKESFPIDKYVHKRVATPIFPAPVFRKEGANWLIVYEGKEVRLQEMKGLYDIQKLLSQPRQLFHCAELMGGMVDENSMPLLDEKAKQAYHKKLLQLQNAVEAAGRNGQFALMEQLQDEYDALISHLSGSLGLQGRPRETGSPVEKARSAVTWRIRSAIARIEKQHPLLGAHLSNAIKTGTCCSYQPEKEMEWQV